MCIKTHLFSLIRKLGDPGPPCCRNGERGQEYSMRFSLFPAGKIAAQKYDPPSDVRMNSFYCNIYIRKMFAFITFIRGKFSRKCRNGQKGRKSWQNQKSIHKLKYSRQLLNMEGKNRTKVLTWLHILQWGNVSKNCYTCILLQERLNQLM